MMWTASACRHRFHGVSGALSIQRVEEIFTSKVGSMDQFDWFMGYNVGFLASSLDPHIERLRSFYSSFLCASWHALEHTCSVLVHVHGTLMVVERRLDEPCGGQNLERLKALPAHARKAALITCLIHWLLIQVLTSSFWSDAQMTSWVALVWSAGGVSSCS